MVGPGQVDAIVALAHGRKQQRAYAAAVATCCCCCAAIAGAQLVRQSGAVGGLDGGAKLARTGLAHVKVHLLLLVQTQWQVCARVQLVQRPRHLLAHLIETQSTKLPQNMFKLTFFK